MSSPWDDKEGYHSPIRRNVDSLDGGSDGATMHNDNEATGRSASSALAEDNESSYLVTLTPGWRRVDAINKKTVTFASDVKEGGVIMVKNENEDSAIGWGWDYETPNRLAFICYDANESGTLTVEQENESSAIGEEDERKEGTTVMVEEDSGQSMNELAMTDEGMLEGYVVVPTSLSPPPVEEDEPRSKKGLALLLLILVVSIITILILVFFR